MIASENRGGREKSNDEKEDENEKKKKKKSLPVRLVTGTRSEEGRVKKLRYREIRC